jgi:hypothetical protein
LFEKAAGDGGLSGSWTCPSGLVVSLSLCPARARIRAATLLSASKSRKVIICSISLENKRSSVQSTITRSFLGNRGSFIKYTIRHSHQATKPENLIPNTLATPVRRPMVASCPNVVKTNGCGGRPRIAASMFFATTSPSRKPCCAVGG